MGCSGSKANLKDIKSKYILQSIFTLLEEKKSLKIIRFNKNIRKRLNININNYKKISELIEIELKKVNNKYGKYINIKMEDKKYYRIYFDNNKVEIKRYYIDKGEQIKNIKIIIDYQIK